MSGSLTKLHCEIDDSTTLQIYQLVKRDMKNILPASQPFIWVTCLASCQMPAQNRGNGYAGYTIDRIIPPVDFWRF